MRAVAVARGLGRPGVQAFYTAQTGKDARERWRDLVQQVKSSPLASRCTVRQAAGSEQLILPNGSAFRCFSPVATSLHGYTPPLVMLDEAFAHDDLAGEDLMAAIIPAQATLKDRQLWIVSTAGTAASTFLNKWVDAGRAGADGVALFEWAAADGSDPYDPETWWRMHPALGFTIGQDDIATAASALSRAEFERAYLNRRTLTSTHLIPSEAWTALGPTDSDPQDPPAPDQDLVLTYDVAHDRQSATIVATWRAGARVCGRIVQRSAGYRWVADEVRRLADTLGASVVGADDGGAAREVTDELRRAGVDVEVIGARDYATASGALLGAIQHGGLQHDGTSAFADAALGASVRPMGDGIAFSRRHSTGDISPLVAWTVGAWLLSRVPAPEPEPLIYVGRN